MSPSFPTGVVSEWCKMRVLGVDPAVAGATGYGIVEFEGARRAIASITIQRVKVAGTVMFAARLREIHQLIANW